MKKPNAHLQAQKCSMCFCFIILCINKIKQNEFAISSTFIVAKVTDKYLDCYILWASFCSSGLRADTSFMMEKAKGR